MQNELVLIRGVSGSGKTTLAKTMARGLGTNAVFAADDWFYDSEGNYNFDLTQRGQAHRACQANVQHVMLARSPIKHIVVHNTFTTEKEMQPYLQMAESYNYKVTVMNQYIMYPMKY